MTDDRPTRWICGHNIAGYLPDTDEPPYPYATFDDAKRALIDDMRHVADSIEPGSDEEVYAEDLTNLAEDLNLDNGPLWWGEVAVYRSGSQIWWIEHTTDYNPEQVDE